MEEDIKILRTFLQDRMAVYNEDLDKHLENILNRLEQDERVIEEMAKYIEDTVEDDICNKENCYADRYINGHCKKCVNCIIEHFIRKCE